MKLALALLFPTALAAAAPPVTDRDQLLALIGTVRESASLSSRPIEIKAVGGEHDGRPILRFRLKNNSTDALTLDMSRFPWGPSGGVSIILVLPDGRTLVPTFAPLPIVMGPPPPWNVTLTGGDERLGDVLIDPYNTFHSNSFVFTRKNRIPHDSDIVVLWTYRPPGPESGRVSDSPYSGVATIHTPAKAPAGSNYRLERP